MAPRLQLHAQELRITHPEFGTAMHFSCEPDF